MDVCIFFAHFTSHSCGLVHGYIEQHGYVGTLTMPWGYCHFSDVIFVLDGEGGVVG